MFGTILESMCKIQKRLKSIFTRENYFFYTAKIIKTRKNS